MDAGQRTGVVVIRLWMESADEAGFRARIFLTGPSSKDDARRTPAIVSTAATVEVILSQVGSWLEGFISPSGGNTTASENRAVTPE